jgi:flagellar biosynthesis protein FliR
MIALAVLVAMRLVPSALLLPVLGGPLAPWTARLALTAAAALGLALVQPPEAVAAAAATPAAGLVALAVKELAVGAVLALVAAAPLVAADVAGRWIGGAVGGAEATAGPLTSLLAVVVFFGIDGHLIVIGALATSYDAVPLLGGLDRAAAADQVLAAVVALLAAAIALAAPSVVVAGLVEAGVGLAARAGGLGAGAGAAAAVRAAAVIAFVAASATLLAVTLAGGLGAAARSVEATARALTP